MVRDSIIYTGRSEIISYIGSYHASTFGALSISGISLNMKRRLGPLLPETYHIPYPDCGHCYFGKRKETCSMECFQFIERSMDSHIPPEEVAAIIIEPIAGDFGFIEPSEEYFRKT
ncbi:aminotransferase class III-fold pyridoxal phosphate-dependent enzyme [Gudongella sp. DL1XJH-153]|uniref:aminotransferase class III-fold pyridoxal phosphate-dependent enzyme n=1 Tax=Gudongella sp. DL1XJH-153 TaxID=3409804 RepID=UPI003BB80CA7